MTYVLNLNAIAEIPAQQDPEMGPHVILAEVERDALVAEVRGMAELVAQLAEGLRAEADQWDYEPMGRWITWDDDQACWLQNRVMPFGSEGRPLVEANPALAEALFKVIAP